MLTFKEIFYKNAIIGEQYMIIEHDIDNGNSKNIIYYGKFMGINEDKNLSDWSNITYADGLYDIFIYKGNISLNRYINFHSIYKLISKKKQIQQAMEQRALNIILRKIIGDEFFFYINDSKIKMKGYYCFVKKFNTKTYYTMCSI